MFKSVPLFCVSIKYFKWIYSLRTDQCNDNNDSWKITLLAKIMITSYFHYLNVDNKATLCHWLIYKPYPTYLEDFTNIPSNHLFAITKQNWITDLLPISVSLHLAIQGWWFPSLSMLVVRSYCVHLGTKQEVTIFHNR